MRPFDGAAPLPIHPYAEVEMEIARKLRDLTHRHPIMLFMRGSPDRPMCQGSLDVVRALRRCQADFSYVDVQEDPEVRAYLPKHSDAAELPQLFLNGEFIGGADVVGELLAQGELKGMLNGAASLLRPAV